MTETSRVRRWRDGKRQQGLKAVTVWLTQEEELRLKDLALQWHCSPSAVIQRALAQVPTRPSSQNGSPPDTLQLRELIRAELDAREAERPSVTETVTEAVTDTLARDLPGMVRQLVEGLALAALGVPVTETNRDVTDTELPGEATPRQPSQRPRGAMRQRILTLLREHPEGLSAEQIRASLQPERPLGDTLQGMQKAGVVTTHGEGRRKRYFVE
jgi:predicted transcriptional regulator